MYSTPREPTSVNNEHYGRLPLSRTARVHTFRTRRSSLIPPRSFFQPTNFVYSLGLGLIRCGATCPEFVLSRTPDQSATSRGGMNWLLPPYQHHRECLGTR